jgi:polysaccharide biosynthesis protein PslG
MAARNPVRKQLRGFVTAWTALTALIAVATFFAIYLTYGGPSLNLGSRNVALPLPTDPQSAQSVAAIQVTQPPTLAVNAAPSATATTEEPATTVVEADETEEAEVEVAQASTETPSDEEVEAVETDESDSTSRDTEVDAAAQADMEPTSIPVEDDSFQVGLQVQPDPGRNEEYQDGWMRDVSQNIGFDWVKIQVRWEDIEPEQGEYDWNALRYVFRSARRFNVKVMVSVVTAPEWAREEGVNTDMHGPPADPQDYVNFVSEMLNRFTGDIHAIEVWNEQNLDREWMSTGGLSATNYVDLLRQTYQAVKAIDPNVIVISGALSPGGGWTENDGRVSAIDDFSYFDGMLQAGVLDYADCIGAHHNGYNIGPSVLWNEVDNDSAAEFRGPFDNPHHSWSFRSTLEEYNRKIQLAGGTQKLCITEFGWASTEDLDDTPAGFEFAADNTLDEQAEWTIEALDNMEEWDFVWLAFIWNFNYGPQAGWDPSNDNVPYSIIGPEWVHRPVYDALIEWAAEHNGSES